MSAGGVSSDSNSNNPGHGITGPTGTRRAYSKTHASYWKSRLERRTYTRNGKTFELAEWSVRIHFNGIRKSFDLETANREESAVKARDIYLFLLAKGWSATRIWSFYQQSADRCQWRRLCCVRQLVNCEIQYFRLDRKVLPLPPQAICQMSRCDRT